MIENSYALSPMQQGMLFHHLLGTQPGVDLEQIICEPHEELDLPAFQLAWERVVARHPALRTAFRWQGLPAPVQEVYCQVGVLWTSEDWRGYSPQEQQQRFEAFLAADRQRGFDLTSPPLMRLTLLRLGQAAYYCVWTVHHVVTDSRSWAVVLHEVFDHYEAICHGTALHLGTPRPFREHVEGFAQRDQQADEAFWRQLLHGFKTPTSLGNWQSSVDSPRGMPYGMQIMRLSAVMTAALRDLARAARLHPGNYCPGRMGPPVGPL